MAGESGDNTPTTANESEVETPEPEVPTMPLAEYKASLKPSNAANPTRKVEGSQGNVLRSKEFIPKVGATKTVKKTSGNKEKAEKPVDSSMIKFKFADGNKDSKGEREGRRGGERRSQGSSKSSSSKGFSATSSRDFPKLS